MRSLGLLLAINAIAAEPGYVDSRQCRRCHSEIFDSYQSTGMGRSFQRVTSVPPLAGFLHEASTLFYSTVERSGSIFLRRSQPPVEKRLDYAIGSGLHSRTFVNATSTGKLTELPLSWYAESGGHWNMSPGYDRPDHSDFRREISDSCLFCHNGYPSKANGGLAEGIDCQRCHGPGELHARGTGAIVNPAKLTPERALEVCLQCHLESASRTLPDSIRRVGRTAFSYRPGEILSDFILFFEFLNTPDDRITVNGSAYGLMKSKCFLQSAGRLTCTSCHDPHRQLAQAESEARYTQVCRGCHPSIHEASRRNCTDCHMQKRRTEDAVHVVMTEHHIRRAPLNGNLLAPLRERHNKITGRTKLLYPRELPATPANAVYLAMAEGEPEGLKRAIAEAKPAGVEPYLALALALRKAGRTSEALLACNELLGRFPGEVRAYVALSELSMAQGQTERAIALLERASPRLLDNTDFLNALAVLYSDKERFDKALVLLARALQIDPEDPVSWLNLGVCLEAKGDRAGAAAAYDRTIALDPGSSRAKQYRRTVFDNPRSRGLR